MITNCAVLQESEHDSDSDAESVGSASASHLLQLVAEPSFKVFVRKLPPSLTKEDMESHLRVLGLSDHVRNITFYHDKSKTPKGYGYIEFSPPDVGRNAISVLNSSLLKGMHKIEAHEYRKETKKPSPRKEKEKLSPSPSDGESYSVHVSAHEGRLPSSIEDSHLRAHFWEFESCLDKAYIVRDRNTKQTKGYAFVVFKSKQVAESVVERLNCSTLHGCQLKLSLATKRHKGAPSPHKYLASQACLPHAVSVPQPITPLLPQCFPPPEHSTTICLSNLNPELDRESIVTLCEGEVTDFKVVHADSKTKMVNVTFASNAFSKRALDKLNGKVFLGHTVCASFIQPLPMPQLQPLEPKSLRAAIYPVKVTHLAETVSEECLSKIFSQAGRIVTFKVFNRYARINYSCESEADKAVSMFDGMSIDGRSINVSKREPSTMNVHSPSTEPQLQAVTVQVSNLNPNMQVHEHWKCLTETFSAYKSATVKDVCPPTAHVEFSDATEANSALECLNNSVVGGSLVSVQLNPAENCMYPVKVTQLAASLDESSICHIFREAGEIIECKVFSTTNRYALVNFKSEPEADNAVRMFHGKVIDRMAVNVSKKSPRPRNPQAQSSPPQAVIVEVSNLNPKMQIHEHWKCLTNLFSAYKSAKVEDVCPPLAYVKFSQEAEACTVVKVLNGSYIGGAMVEVKVIHDKPW